MQVSTSSKPLKMSKNFLLAGLLILGSCYSVPSKIDPKINYAVQDKYLKRLPSPFKPLSESEKREDWGREYQIALAFSRQLDLYQAMTAFKRASILIPPELKERKLEIEYEIVLCYYIGQKYGDVVQTYEKSELRFVDASFPAKRDLLVILYDSYMKTCSPQNAERILYQLQQADPVTEEHLTVSTAISTADFPQMNCFAETSEYSYLKPLIHDYTAGQKSVRTAKALNMVLPGAGYLYVGQKQSALTAFLLNSAFIAATYYFFHQGNPAAGAVFASFETGWYFGGIYGAGQEAKVYNERLYEKKASPLMNAHNLFPVLMLKYAF
jgi:hypothetical protein